MQSVTDTFDLADELGVSVEDVLEAAIQVDQEWRATPGHQHDAFHVFRSVVMNNNLANLSEYAAAEVRKRIAAVQA